MERGQGPRRTDELRATGEDEAARRPGSGPREKGWTLQWRGALAGLIQGMVTPIVANYEANGVGTKEVAGGKSVPIPTTSPKR